MGASVPSPAAKNSQTEASRTTAPTRVVSAAKQAERHVTGDRPWEKNDEEDRARREERLHGGSSIAQV